jgi:hypothetical protein
VRGGEMMLFTIQISKEQARLLWTLINSGQTIGLDRMSQHISQLRKYSVFDEALNNWSSECAKEHMALQAFKDELVKVLEDKQQ